MRYTVDSLLMESGLFWCVYCNAGGCTNLLVRAFHGEGAEDEARAHAARLNEGGA